MRVREQTILHRFPANLLHPMFFYHLAMYSIKAIRSNFILVLSYEDRICLPQ